MTTGISTGTTGRARMHREATYNTPPAATDFWNIPFFAPMNLGTSQGLVPNPTIGAGSDPQAPFRDVFVGKGDLTVPVDARYFGLHLAALFGDPVTTHPSGYQHVFSSGATGQPTPQAIEVAHLGLDTPKYMMNSGILYKSMEISLARSGAVAAKFGVVSTMETGSGSSAAGTPANLVDTSVKYFSHLTGVIKRNTTVVGNILSGTLMFDNGLETLDPIGNQGYIAGGVRTEASLKLSNVSARFNNTTLYDDSTGNTPVQIDWILSNSGSESLTFTIPKVLIPRPQIPFSGPGGVNIAFDFMANADASNKMLTMTLLNDYAGTAYAP
jgi:hypothetical protein